MVLMFCYDYKGRCEEACAPKYLFQWVTDFASIAFGYPNAFCLGSTQTPVAILPERRKGETPKLRHGGTSVYF